MYYHFFRINSIPVWRSRTCLARLFSVFTGGINEFFSRPFLSRFLVCLFMVLALPGRGSCLDGNDLMRLKKHGIKDKTIQLLVKEKVIETCLFTVQEIIDMKRAGVSDETLQLIIKEGSFIKDSKPIIYGEKIKSIRFTTAEDIVRLKKAGISDEVLKAIVKYCSRDTGSDDRRKAWEFLRSMGFIVDDRYR